MLERSPRKSDWRLRSNQAAAAEGTDRETSGSMAETADQDAARATFTLIGMAPKTIEDTLQNKKVTKELMSVIEEAGAKENGGCDKSVGALLYSVATIFPQNALKHRKTFLSLIMDGKVKNAAQMDGGMKFLKQIGAEELGSMSALEEACGVGMDVSSEDIATCVASVISEHEGKLKEMRYHMNTNPLLGKALKSLKWADASAVREELASQVAALLGPKTEEDLKPPPKKEKKKVDKKPETQKKSKVEEDETWKTADPYAFFPKPQENNNVHTTVYMSDGTTMKIANSSAKLQEHLQSTGGKVMTRFPPEPNGYLHIGHAKAMFIDFGMAEQYNGCCYLRYDDTNPEAEKQEYIDHIQDIIQWLGWKPFKITYSSDYFHELHALAVRLIETGHAYVCHQNGDQIKESREKKEPSPWRDRPKEESLKLFEDMRKGLIDEGTATLRMKMDHKNENANMFDLIAYRIKFVPHPKSGDEWCIYPSYDFTHCIVDSLENITHSLCTLEFESRRASYYWLLDVLDLYKPVVWEYSRLNITHTVLSKRKLNKLVTDKYVAGWDDPRLMTLAGLRRRGVTPASINLFCRELGITRSDSEVHPHKLEYHVRTDLDATSERALAVLRPLKVVIVNLPDDHIESVEAKIFPGRSDEGYQIPFTKIVYIESTDFRKDDSKNYYGLAPGKTVMLRYGYPITCTDVITDATGNVVEVHATYDPDFAGKKPPKGVLNWVGQPAPGKHPSSFEARLYGTLFKSANVTADWLEDLNPENLIVLRGCICTDRVASAKIGTRFQLERLGYFCVDPDSTDAMPVLNRTVTLKDSYSQA